MRRGRHHDPPSSGGGRRGATGRERHDRGGGGCGGGARRAGVGGVARPPLRLVGERDVGPAHEEAQVLDVPRSLQGYACCDTIVWDQAA